MSAKTKPSPFPYYEVIVNNSSAYLIVHVKDNSNKYEGVKREIWRIKGGKGERTEKNPVGVLRWSWQDYLDLKDIQCIYFEILEKHYEKPENVIEVNFNSDIPF